MKRIIVLSLIIGMLALCGCGIAATTNNANIETTTANTTQPITEEQEVISTETKIGVCNCDIIRDYIVGLFGTLDEVGIDYSNENFDRILSEKLGTETTLDEVSDICFSVCSECEESNGKSCSCDTVCVCIRAIIETIEELGFDNPELNEKIQEYFPRSNDSLVSLLKYMYDLCYECDVTHN